MLNAERHTVSRLVNRGRVNKGEAEKMNENIEERMKRLMDSPPAFQMPKSIELLRKVSWLKDLDEKKIEKVVELFQNRIFSVDQVMVKEDENDEGLFVIVRGTVKVQVGDVVVDILGAGSVVGEMAILTDHPRSATVSAESPVTAMWVPAAKMKKVMSIVDDLEDKLWEFASGRFVENMLRVQSPYNSWHQDEFKEWIMSGKISNYTEGTTIDLNGKIGILLTGQIYKSGGDKKVERAPAVIESGDIVAEGTARVYTAIIKNG